MKLVCWSAFGSLCSSEQFLGVVKKIKLEMILLIRSRRDPSYYCQMVWIFSFHTHQFVLSHSVLTLTADHWPESLSCLKVWRDKTFASSARCFSRNFSWVRNASKDYLGGWKKHQTHGTRLNLNRGHSGRPRTARSAEVASAVRARDTSAGRNGIGLCPGSFSRITRLDLGLHLHLMHRHELLSADHARRQVRKSSEKLFNERVVVISFELKVNQANLHS